MNKSSRIQSQIGRLSGPSAERIAAAANSFRVDPLPPDCGGIERLDCYLLYSAVLPEPESRQFSVALPRAYFEDPGRRFPVFYLHDGQNLFDPHTSYIPGSTWQANETADRLAAAGAIEPVILVGINNTGLRRMAEYTPTRDFRLGGGEGHLYGQLLVEELKPFIDSTYRTRTDASETGLGGSSLGGLVSLYLGLRYPEIFGRLAVISPSIWWDHRSVLTLVSRLEQKLDLKIWLDIGTGEGQRHVRDTDLLNQMLIRKGWRAGQDLSMTVVPGAVHSEHAWASRFDQILEFLYPPSAC